MKNPFSAKAPNIDVGRNAFDRSTKSVFSASVGELLPYFVLDVTGGSHVKLSNQSFSRTQPVKSAAFTRLSENFEYFFVPYRLLWSYWNSFRTHVSDENSTTMQTEVQTGDAWINPFKPENAENPGMPVEIPMFSFNEVFKRYNDTESMTPSEDSGTPISSAIEYNNENNFFGIPFRYGAYKLFNLLGYGQLEKERTYLEFLSNHFDYEHDYWFNPFRLLAYQKVYYDHYRLTEFVPNNPFAYNVDIHSNPQRETTQMGLIDHDCFDYMFQLHYRPLKKDFFTAVRPYQYWYGQTNSNGNWQEMLELPNSYYAKRVTSYGDLEADKDADISPALIQGLGGINASAVRLSFVMERLARVQALTPKHYDEQFNALFGYKPKDGMNESVRIGSFNNTVLIDEITANVTTDETVKGSIAGKGISMSRDNSTIDFDVPEDGIILGIYSISPIMDYPSYGVDRFNTKSVASDYYQQAFDNLGPHVIRQMERFFAPGRNDYNNRVLGLQTPYLEYKTGVDKVFGEFNPAGVYSEWSAPRIEGFYGNKDYPQPSEVPTSDLRVSDLLVNPKDYDSIFAMSYNGTEYSSQFIVNGYTQVQCVQNMSVSGEPYGLGL